MGTKDQTYLTEFILLCLSSDQQTQIMLCVVFHIYLMAVFVNLLITVLMHHDSQFHAPCTFSLKNI